MPLRPGICRRTRLLLPLLSSLLVVTAGLRTAAAQTVIVRSAPQGSTIELTMNGGAAISATADNFGDATLTVPARTTEAAVQIHVDDCGNRVRVLLVERGIQPSTPEPGCNRIDVGSVFVMRPVTTFVVDVDGSATSVHVTQGPPPPSWVQRGASQRSQISWGMPTRGLTASAAAGYSAFSNAVSASCGDVQSCERTNFSGVVSLDIDYWITPFIGAGVAYVKPADVAAKGSGDTFRFTSQLTTRLVTIVGKGGVPLGPARLYGFGGLNRHEATLTTSETIDDATVVIDSVSQTIKGGTQTFAQKTTGWNWVAGGGVEAWLTRWVAIYGELTLATIKGAAVSGGEGGIDDRAAFIAAGVRVRLGL